MNLGALAGAGAGPLGSAGAVGMAGGLMTAGGSGTVAGAASTGGAVSTGAMAGTGGMNGGSGAPAGGSAGMISAAGENPGGTSAGGMGVGGSTAGSASGAGTSAGGMAVSSTRYAYAASVENTGTDCVIPDLADPSALPEIPKFPDPFTSLAGTRISRRSDWHCRRREILDQAEKYIYGAKPTPDTVTGTVSEDEITVHVEAEGASIDFSARVVLPSTGEAPYPAIINVGGSGITLGEDRILDQGVAIIYYDHYELGVEGAPEASRGLDNPGKFYDIYGGDHSAGLLMAWAWGASRMIDVIQADAGGIIDVGALGVTGCSRNGKGAFAVGLFDERIALTIPHETSTAGVPAYRIVDILNTERTDHNYFGLNWLSNNFEPFVYENGVSNAVKLPIDTHSLVASFAPRGLLVLENPHQAQFSAPAGHTAVLAGAEVYRALGVEGNVSYHSNVAQTPHCSYKDEYTELLVQNIGKFLKHDNDEPGLINASPQGSGDLSEWKDWETPELEADVELSGLE